MPLNIFRTKYQCFDAQIFTFVKLLMQNPKLKRQFTQKNVVLKVAVQQIRCCWHQPSKKEGNIGIFQAIPQLGKARSP